ncbi:MAG: endonuclease/exonuclease/phosphatase family protein [Gemmataceae bacterium]
MSSSDPSNAPPTDAQGRELLISFLLTVAPMALIFLLPATHARELPENLLIGLIVGTCLWLLLYVGAVVGTMLRVFRRRDGSPRASFGAIVVLFFVVLALAGASYLGAKPLHGVLMIMGGALPVAAIYLALSRSGRRTRGFGWLAAAGVAAVLVLMLVGPLQPRPDQLVHGDPGKHDLVVLSWNLGTGQPASTPALDSFLDGVTETILQHEADVVALQEVDGQAQLDRLLARLGPEWRGQVSGEVPRATAVLTRLPGKFFAWNKALWYGGPATVRLSVDHGRLEIASVHLPPEQASAARLQYAAWLHDTARLKTNPVLFAGDLNLDPTGFWDRWSSVFTDSPERDALSLARLASGADDVGRLGSGTAALSRRVDYILVPLAWECVDYQVLYGQKQGRMDHHPIRVRIRPARLEFALTGIR